MSNAPQITLVRADGAHEVRSQSECLERAGRLAAALHSGGRVAVGDRVGLFARNSIEFLEISIAVASAGGCPVPINWHWTASEVAHVLSDSGISLVFCDDSLRDTALSAGLRAGTECSLISTRGRDEEAPSVDSLIATQSEPLPHIDGALAASMGLIYTSGTTGRPKGVQRELMTPHQILSVAGSTAQRMGLRDGGSALIAGPLYHTSPNAIAVLALRMGSNLVIMEKFDATQFLQLVSEYRIEHAKVVPTMLSRLLSVPPEERARYDISSLTHLIHSAAPCPPAIKREAIDWFGSALLEFYGCSEAGTLTWITAEQWLAHPGSVGLPADGSAVRIVDEQGVDLPANTPGLVEVKGADYWPRFQYVNDASGQQPEFIHVGDRGYLDEDGFLYLTGRSAEVVNIGGTNVYPAEIEAAALSHPSVEDAGAIGVPASGDLGEEVELHVVLRPGHELDSEALIEHLARSLASIKLPRRIRLRDELPRDDNGKLYRATL